jgi:hypothetical protein
MQFTEAKKKVKRRFFMVTFDVNQDQLTNLIRDRDSDASDKLHAVGGISQLAQRLNVDMSCGLSSQSEIDDRIRVFGCNFAPRLKHGAT